MISDFLFNIFAPLIMARTPQVMPVTNMRTFEGRTYHYNLELFKEIGRFIKYRHVLGTKAVLLNLVGNIVAFFPFGFFLPVLHPKCRSIFYTTFFSCIESTIIAIADRNDKTASPTDAFPNFECFLSANL